MKSFKFFSSVVLKFILLLLGFFILFLCIIILGTGYNIWKHEKSTSNPERVYSLIKEGPDQGLNREKKALLDKDKIWYLHLDQGGKYLDSYKAPKKLQRDYKAQDLVRLTRWYLEDYPVFTFIDGDQIHILGYPPDSYSKFPSNYFHIDLFFQTFYLLAFSLVFIIGAIFWLYYRSKKRLWQEIYPLSQAIYRLSENKPLQLEENGNLVDLKKALNQSANNLQKVRQDQQKWIRGISHDLRTPLTIISGYSQALKRNIGDSTDLDHIEKNIQRMEKILESLNISYMIENYNPSKENKGVDLKKLLREISVDVLNTFPPEKVKIQTHFPEEKMMINGHKDLLDRAFRNIIYNSIDHNKEVIIDLFLEEEGGKIKVSIKDNGGIAPNIALDLNATPFHKEDKGFGIWIVKRIVSLHRGNLYFSYSNPGLMTSFSFDK